jgi:alpha-beta hydrolase superfamily lysophospholipase
MHTFRTKFAKNIIAEFLPPARKTKYAKVIIICDGAPTVPSKKMLMRFWSQKGYWVFHPRYRGTWESGGKFLKISPEKDILAIIDQLPKGFSGFLTYTSQKRFKVRADKIYLLGGSFGGPAVILASLDRRVTKAVAFCPVVDWRKLGKAESLNKMAAFFKTAFGEGYRFSIKDWNKLKDGIFYSPVSQVSRIDGKKLLIVQTRDDKSVTWKPVANFATKAGAKLWLLKSGGHIGHTMSMDPRFYKKIKQFLDSKSSLE